MKENKKKDMNVPYFNNVNDYVNSLPYGKPLKDNGFIYESPFNSRYGERPEVVYERLFKYSAENI